MEGHGLFQINLAACDELVVECAQSLMQCSISIERCLWFAEALHDQSCACQNGDFIHFDADFGLKSGRAGRGRGE